MCEKRITPIPGTRSMIPRSHDPLHPLINTPSRYWVLVATPGRSGKVVRIILPKSDWSRPPVVYGRTVSSVYTTNSHHFWRHWLQSSSSSCHCKPTRRRRVQPLRPIGTPTGRSTLEEICRPSRALGLANTYNNIGKIRRIERLHIDDFRANDTGFAGRHSTACYRYKARLTTYHHQTSWTCPISTVTLVVLLLAH